MARRYYPVGIQSFEKLRSLNAVYVDKTELIYRLVKSSSYVFLSRPRRFGKSLLSSTIACYFEGRKELFTGLAMEQLEKDWIKYPVFHLDISLGKGRTSEQLRDYLGRMMNEYEELYETSCDGLPGDKLENLIKQSYKKTGQKAVVVIDEYDAPLLDILHDDKHLEEVRNVMKQFYGPLKACDQYLRFVFITGITKFSQLSIFSTINNLENISMDDKYSAICGITESELHKYFEEDMPALAEELECTPNEAITQLKMMYDGYHFSSKSEDIYNPFSLLSAIKGLKLNTYWFSSGTPTYLIHQLKRFNMDINTLDCIKADVTSFDVPTEAMTDALPLLYQSGYITIKEYNKKTNSYIIGIPNREVKSGLMQNLIPAYTSLKTNDVMNGLILDFYGAIIGDDIDSALKVLRAFMAKMPYSSGDNKILEDAEKTEAYYHRIFYLIFSFFNSKIQTEVRTATGRIDMVMFTLSSIYVFKLKTDRPAAEALAQIDAKDYAVPYETDGRKVVKIGVSFSTKTHTVEDWIIE